MTKADVERVKREKKVDEELSEEVKDSIDRAREQEATYRTIPAIRKRL